MPRAGVDKNTYVIDIDGNRYWLFVNVPPNVPPIINVEVR